MKPKDWFFKTRKMNPEPKVAMPQSDDQLTPACTEIHEWISQQLGGRDDSSANRCSAAPNCVKKRWYQNQGEKGEDMQPRSLITFVNGDVGEHVMKYFISQANVGPGKLYSEVDFGVKTGTFTIQHREFDIYQQETLTIEFEGLQITGHPDGWGKRNSDGEWELIEVKTASNYGYDKFVAGEDEYINQVHALMMTGKARERKVRSARFFFMRKETAHIFDRLVQFDVAIAKQVKREYFVAAGKEEPVAPHAPVPEMTGRKPNKRPTGRMILAYPCTYCPFKNKCFGLLELDFQGGKPVWVVRTQKEEKSG